LFKDRLEYRIGLFSGRRTDLFSPYRITARFNYNFLEKEKDFYYTVNSLGKGKIISELQIIKGDKQPIGSNLMDKNEFTSHVFPIRRGMRLYIFTDGITDQFGGEQKKKFSSNQLYQTILETRNQTIETQIEYIK
jgi:hypothetical protein